jgi:hypothetical protein
MSGTVISVEEARKILNKDADTMSDAEIEEVISTLSFLAKDTLETVRLKMLRKRDAKRLAELTYDIYKKKTRKS